MPEGNDNKTDEDEIDFEENEQLNQQSENQDDPFETTYP